MNEGSAFGYLDTMTMIFGAITGATHGLDTAFGEEEGPPPPPWGGYTVWMDPRGTYYNNTAGNLWRRDIRPWTARTQIDTFLLLVVPDAGYSTFITWPDSATIVGNCDSIVIKDSATGGARVNVNLLHARSVMIPDSAGGYDGIGPPPPPGVNPEGSFYLLIYRYGAFTVPTMHTIMATAGAGGSISPSGLITLPEGTSQTFSVTPWTGFEIDSIIVDGTDTDSLTGYTFNNISADHTLRVVFGPLRGTIIIMSDSSITASPAGVDRLDSGSVGDLTFTPVDIGGFGSFTPVPPGAPPGTQVINIPPGDGESGFFRSSFTLLPCSENVILSGAGNTDDFGRVFVNGHAITPSLFSNSPGVLTEYANASFLTVDQSLFKAGQNELLVSDYNTSGPSGAAFYARITFIYPAVVWATAGSHGAISPQGFIFVNQDSSRQIIVTPDAGYRTDSVIVDGVKVDSTASYTFTHLHLFHTIRATFKQNIFLILTEALGCGRITPSDSILLVYDSSQTFTFTPNAGYRIDSILVDGVYAGDSSSFTFHRVDANHTIVVRFARIVVSSLLGVNRGWNLVSVPTGVCDFRTSLLFPHAVSAAYCYQGTYTTKDTLACGEGYWLRFSTPCTDSITGFMVLSDTVCLAAGWNLIGSISVPVPVSFLTSDSGGVILSQFFAFRQGYAIVDTIEPGSGYWVKVNKPCDLILSSTAGSSRQKQRITIVTVAEQPPVPPPVEGLPANGLPENYGLDQAYPNPFNPATTIRYQLPADSRVTLRVYDLLGRVVQTLAEGVQEAGYKQLSWNASNFASGLYFYRLEAASVSD
ncbi:MAG TPA: T9SS type A sorting domain-containing protein, partial [Bacteroidota bacterium]|nr:T9SS type A sorting domain-containing protein [Bacteroidota bacterium]